MDSDQHLRLPPNRFNYMGGKVAFAFALGHVRALMQTVEAEE